MEVLKLTIADANDRKIIAGILADNGYIIHFETTHTQTYGAAATNYVVIHNAKIKDNK